MNDMEKIKELIDSSEAIVIGAGAGLSTASGFIYDGDNFLNNFKDMYDKYGISECSCRKQQAERGEGSGDIMQYWCMGLGDFADYCKETGMGYDITYEEALEVLERAEDKGYVHQVTNIDGKNINQSMRSIEIAMDTVVDGFRHQLDELYKSDAVSIETEIDVLTKMINRETATAQQDFGLGGQAVQTAPQQKKQGD